MPRSIPEATIASRWATDVKAETVRTTVLSPR
jgi:hypothetical protein